MFSFKASVEQAGAESFFTLSAEQTAGLNSWSTAEVEVGVSDL